MLGALRRQFPPTIRQLLASDGAGHGAKIEVNGWVKSVRRQKNVSFAVISDGSSTRGLQAVFAKDIVPVGLNNGCSVRLRGELVQSRGALQDKEFRVETAEVVGECDPNSYPIQKQALGVDYLRDQCHLRSRVDKISEMLRIRDSLTRGMHAYFESQGFMYAHTPVITSSDCEGGGETFSVTSEELKIHENTTEDPSELFFHKNAFLTVSSQLHLEALSAARTRVYTLAPCFRAERSQTNRHLAEFWMLEAEWAFTSCAKDVCAVVEDVVKVAVNTAIRDEGAEDADIHSRVQVLSLDRPWTHMSYTDAIRELQAGQAAARNQELFAFKPEWGRALQSEHEKWLADIVKGPVFVTDYPASLKPFYMRLNDNGDSEPAETVACFDLLVPGLGELVGGSLREERLDMLDSAMERHGLMDREEYGWYRELRMFGGAPHGGFGLGFERLVSIVSGQPNVRECIAMPRWAGRMLL